MDRSLPRAEWTHAAHFAAALWLMRQGHDAAAVMPGLISAYNESAGVVNGGFGNTVRHEGHEALVIEAFRGSSPDFVLRKTRM